MSRIGKVLFLLSGISIASFGVARFLVGEFIPALWVPIALFFIFMVAGLLADRKLYGEFLSMKTTKHGMNMGAMIGMVLVLLVSLNFLAVRHYKSFDFSLAQVNTLSEQSVKLIKNLDADLTVRYFYKKGAEGVEENRRAFRELLKKYQDQSSFIKLEFIELNERPDLAEEYGVNKGSGVVFLDYKTKRNRIEKIEEQEITSALVKVTREKDKSIYFTTGHGEKDLEDNKSAEGLAALKGLLEGNRYVVKPLALTAVPKVPDDADILFIIGPEHPFLEMEYKALQEYLKRGGSVVLAVDQNKNHGLDKLMQEVGIEATNNYIVIVMDTVLGKAINPAATPAADFSSTNAVTKVFAKNQMVLMRLPMSVAKAKNVPAGIEVEEIVKTNEKTVGFSTPKFDTGGEAGPFSVVASAKGKYSGAEGKEFSMVVVGNSVLFGNQLLYQNLNRDLVLNTAAYLAKEENLISISPKEVQVTQMTITPTQFYVFIFGFIIPLPILLLATSGVLWFRRRHA